MRLLNTTTLCFEDFLDEEKIPAYAILSHTWGTEEVNYQEMRVGWLWRLFTTRWKKGYDKIELTCRQACADGLAYCWVEDKTSSAELSEAINSMFRWYAKAALCYAFLPDVNVVKGRAQNLDKSRWFTRGWTLQELIAPSKVNFYGSSWTFFGSRDSMAQSISKVTGIDIDVLRHERALQDVCVARRMSWAAERRTARVEDVAYSLLGIFNVNMALLYGEGTKAFLRLQEHIIHDTKDDTILAWDYLEDSASFTDTVDLNNTLIAPSPAFFAHCRKMRRSRPTHWSDVLDFAGDWLRFKSDYFPAIEEGITLALLNCVNEDTMHLRYVLRLRAYRGEGDIAYAVSPAIIYVKSGIVQLCYESETPRLHRRVYCLEKGSELLDSNNEQYSPSGTMNLIRGANWIDCPLRSMIIHFDRDVEFGFEQVFRYASAFKCVHDKSRSCDHLASRKDNHARSEWTMRIHPTDAPDVVVGAARVRHLASGAVFIVLADCQLGIPFHWKEQDLSYGVTLYRDCSDADLCELIYRHSLARVVIGRHYADLRLAQYTILGCVADVLRLKEGSGIVISVKIG